MKNLRVLLDILAQQLHKTELLYSIVSPDDNKVYYDYWFIDSTLALAILKKKGRISNLICRGHRFDIYDECYPSYGVPFREFTLKHLDSFFIVSKYGRNYVKNNVKEKYHNKIFVSYLGVKTPISLPNKNYEVEEKLIVSLSSMLSFKKVERIPEVLLHINSKVHWIHFGDGQQLDLVKSNCEKLPSNITFELMGHTSNEEVLSFFTKNYVDLFISLSESEGLPVSMMEAQSFGIPIVAFPISGIPEIVKDGKTGLLLDLDDSNTDIANRLEKALQNDYDRTEIQSFFKANFSSEINYKKFTQDLCS